MPINNHKWNGNTNSHNYFLHPDPQTPASADNGRPTTSRGPQSSLLFALSNSSSENITRLGGGSSGGEVDFSRSRLLDLDSRASSTTSSSSSSSSTTSSSSSQPRQTWSRVSSRLPPLRRPYVRGATRLYAIPEDEQVTTTSSSSSSSSFSRLSISPSLSDIEGVDGWFTGPEMDDVTFDDVECEVVGAGHFEVFNRRQREIRDRREAIAATAADADADAATQVDTSDGAAASSATACIPPTPTTEEVRPRGGLRHIPPPPETDTPDDRVRVRGYNGYYAADDDDLSSVSTSWSVVSAVPSDCRPSLARRAAELAREHLPGWVRDRCRRRGRREEEKEAEGEGGAGGERARSGGDDACGGGHWRQSLRRRLWR